MRLTAAHEATRSVPQLATATAASGDERGSADPIAAALAELLEETSAEAAELFLTDRSANRIWMAAHRGLAAEAFRQRTEFGRGEGYPGIVVERDEPIVTRDLRADERYLRTRVPECGFRGYVCAPVRANGRVLGSLQVASRTTGSSLAEELPVVMRAADRLAERLELARLRARERLAEDMVSESELDPKRNLQHKIDRALDAMIQLARADGGIVVLCQAAADTLHPWAWRGLYERACGPLAGTGGPPECPVVAESLDRPDPVARQDGCPTACTVLPTELAIATCLPLLASGRVLGAVSLGYRSRAALPGRYLAELDGMAEQLALAVGDEQAAMRVEERAADAQRRRLLDEIDLAVKRTLQPVILRIERAGTSGEPSPRMRTELARIQGLLLDGSREIVDATRRGSAPVRTPSEPAPVVPSAPFLDLRCFGRLRVFCDSQPIAPERFARRRALTLLKILLTNYGKSIHRDVLVDMLWGDELPKDPGRQLKVIVHYLRRALEPEPSAGENPWVLSSPEGYAFDVTSPHRLDYQDFLSLAHWGDRLNERREPEAALTAYEAAAGLYAGDFLEDERYSDWCAPERDHLRETLLSVLWRGAALRLDGGDAEGALACHRRALLIDPTREDVHRELMRVLWREGRPDDARRQYRLCEEALGRELGASPSLETRSLHRRLTDPHHA